VWEEYKDVLMLNKEAFVVRIKFKIYMNTAKVRGTQE